MVLDHMFPYKEPCPCHQHSDISGRHFGIPAQITATSWHDRRVTASELLRMYSIILPQTHIHSTPQYHAMEDILDDLLPLSLPWNMALQVQNQSAQTNAILDSITYRKVI